MKADVGRRSGQLWLATLLVLLGAWSPLVAQNAGAANPPASPGLYSLSQALRGDTVYRRACASCHLAKNHARADFQMAWHGRTVASLYDYLRSTMPVDTPGELSQQDYLDVTAYLLRLNGVPAGNTPLTADPAFLKTLQIAIPDSLRKKP